MVWLVVVFKVGVFCYFCKFFGGLVVFFFVLVGVVGWRGIWDGCCFWCFGFVLLLRVV